ncbi:type IV pilin N-terminal domain-containing protein [Methanococcoides methylutens]|uniref:type IV pilin N-terminal domain-containing protein n=1 Tax=Methanococcoides methylutens TaxID=2226 RepID=UPI000693ABA8|nr:type IV pilin N-terminal domain-containing protein [Methanococcoides methylutens]
MLAILKNDGAVAPIIGALLLVMLTVLLGGVVAAAVIGDGIFGSISSSTPMAMIEVKDAVGGVPNSVQYKENYVILEHKGGDPLDLDSTFVVLSGDGSSYVGKVGHGGFKVYGQVTAKYYDLTPSGTCATYKSNNPCIDDGLWSAGEFLVLNGDDSINGTDASTVRVSVGGYSDTSNNYGFRQGTLMTVKVFDSTTDRVIAEDIVSVRPLD